MAVKKGKKTEKKEIDKSTPQHTANIPVAETNEQMLEMLASMQAEIAQLKQNNVRPEPTGNISYDKELLDDWMETPAVFFTYKSYLSVFSDRIRGKISNVPSGGKIAFTTAMRYKKAKGKEEEVICISKAIINSKKDAEWIRNSNYFNVIIFETIKEVNDIDAQFADDMQNASTKVRAMNDLQVISACKNTGITLTEDVQNMRLSLVKKFADDEKARRNSISLRIAENSSKDANGNRNAKELDLGKVESSGIGSTNPY